MSLFLISMPTYPAAQQHSRPIYSRVFKQSNIDSTDKRLEQTTQQDITLSPIYWIWKHGISSLQRVEDRVMNSICDCKCSLWGKKHKTENIIFHFTTQWWIYSNGTNMHPKHRFWLYRTEISLVKDDNRATVNQSCSRAWKILTLLSQLPRE